MLTVKDRDKWSAKTKSKWHIKILSQWPWAGFEKNMLEGIAHIFRVQFKNGMLENSRVR